MLAIAALKLGAGAALAIDIDPQALIATRENAARNSVAEQPDGQADPAKRSKRSQTSCWRISSPSRSWSWRPPSRSAWRPGGCVVLSGILQSQAEPVASRYAAWFDMRPATVRDDWALLYGVRRS